MRITCSAVLYFPSVLTLTARCAALPDAAAHSRSALIVISRPIMITTGMVTSFCDSGAGGRTCPAQAAALAPLHGNFGILSAAL